MQRQHGKRWNAYEDLECYGILASEFEKPFWPQLVGTGLTTALLLQLGTVLSHAQWPAVSCLNNYSDDLLVEHAVLRQYLYCHDAIELRVECLVDGSHAARAEFLH